MTTKKTKPKKPKTPPTQGQIQDSVRLRNLFEQRASMSQLDFGLKNEIGNQGMVWQYLNADKPKGSVLNVVAAIKFARGLGCKVSEFSPSIQEEIDRIASFATTSGDAMKIPSVPGESVTNTPQNLANLDGIPPKRATQREIEVGTMYAAAPESSRAAVDAILLKPAERAMLRETKDGLTVFGAIDILEINAIAALASLGERKKANGD